MRKSIKYLSIFITILLVSTSCNNKKINKKSNKEVKEEITTNIPVYNFNQLEPILYKQSNKIVIINFWAMWCAPCVKEMPYLQEFANKNTDVELKFISMDFPKDIETKLKPFLKKKNISADVILLDDPDANTWIDKIDPNWSGAIPFTIIFNEDKRLFYERSFESLADLENEIYKNFKQQ
ncbi:TlpA disulfide reductase family protein [Polaribacter sargassicola]|uniref:TlpA disulfide reductase family protein n=1 Tax=Polaribacter sargassicola TaxID=2836891 RepID=UPI001F2D434B|nr:TlpA disulfide reductase family protein [Polaribacter sp. DS7-9]MCG1037532.1 TlpA family protein disulfide reductase [Polaribacter sp. DS7-9]